MQMRPLLIGTLFILFSCFARSARADFTIFLGVNDKPTLQLAPGLALSFGLVIVSCEFEYVNTGANDAVAGKPSLQTGMGNLIRTDTGFSIRTATLWNGWRWVIPRAAWVVPEDTHRGQPRWRN